MCFNIFDMLEKEHKLQMNLFENDPNNKLLPPVPVSQADGWDGVTTEGLPHAV